MATSNLKFNIVGEDNASSAFLSVAAASKLTKKAFSDVSIAGERVGSIMTKAAAAGPALLAAGAALSSAAAGGVALIGAIGPGVVAGIAAYGGALLAVKSAAAVTSFALQGVSEAVAGQAGALKALTPEGRAFALLLRGLKPEIEGVRNLVQQGMFPGLASATMSLAKTYLPAVRRAATETGIALGSLAADAGQMASRGPWRKDFGTIAHANAVNISLLGNAGLHLANTLRSLLATAMPLTNAFSGWALSASRAVDQWIQGKRASGELEEFWKRAAKTGATLGHIIGNLAVALGNIFKIGAQGAGLGMLKTVEKLTENFEKWTSSANGAEAIAHWFENGRKNLAAMGRLTEAVFGGMQTIGSGSLLAPLIDQITKEVIPPLMQFLHNASASGALNALVSAVASVVKVFAQLSENDSSLKAFSTTLKILADSMLWITRNVPGASQAMSAFFVAVGVSQALKLVGLGGAVKALGGLMLTLAERVLGVTVAETAATAAVSSSTVATEVNTVAATENAAASVASRVAAVAVAAATKAWAAAQWLLNAALDANPIGIVVVAIAALVAGLIYAYKHSETFRNIVNGAFRAVQRVASAAFNWIKSHWKLLAGILGGPVVAATIVIISNWGKIKAGAANLWSAIRSGASKVKGFILLPFQLAKAAVAGVWQNMKQDASTFVGFIAAIPGRLRDMVGRFKDAGMALIHALWEGILSAARSAGGFVSTLVADIKAAINSALDLPLSVDFDRGPLHIHATLIPALAAGGIVNRPTLAMIGEAGPEAVVPLSGRNARSLGGGDVYVTVNASGLVDAASMAKAIEKELTKLKNTRGGQQLGFV